MIKRIPVILDTDPGVDDAVCLALALAYDDVIDLKAITTIGGNNHTEITTRNALDLLKLYGADVPVYAGEKKFLKKEFPEPVAKFHGANGLADIEIPHSEVKAQSERAADAIYRICKENPGEVVICTVGPETNLAVAFGEHPDLKDLVKKICVMGGAIDMGNITPYAEANIGNDAHAADIVFKTGIPLDMIGLNTTWQAQMTAEEFDEIAVGMKKDVYDFLRGLFVFRHGEPMHDAIALATIIDDSFIEWKQADIEIEMNDEIRFGETVVRENISGTKRAAISADKAHYMDILKRLAEHFHN